MTCPSCRQCGDEYTDATGEDAREEAVRKHLEARFQAGDLVIQNGHADCVFEVVRTIPDQERLFVVDNTGKYGRGNEFEIFFEEVSKHFRGVR